MRLFPPGVTLIELSQGFFLSRAIGVAAELNLAGHLQKGENPLSELADLTNTNEEALYRLMRFLAGHGVFTEKIERVFVNNRLSCALIDGEGSVRSMVMQQVTGLNWKLMEELEWSVKTGENSAGKILETDVFTYLKNNPARNKVYNEAMSNTSSLIAGALLSVYSFKRSRVIVDVGGGSGVLLANILTEYPNITGIVFDLEHVVKEVDTTARAFGLEERLRPVSGSLYEEVPSGGDTYILKNVIHILTDEEASELLGKIKKELPDYGRVLIFETIIGKRNINKTSLKLDIQMMVGRPGAKERTKEQFKQLIEKQGLKINRIYRTVAPIQIIEVTLG